jgi:hypothetical protein
VKVKGPENLTITLLGLNYQGCPDPLPTISRYQETILRFLGFMILGRELEKAGTSNI